MINPEDYRVTPETVDGGDVDVDAEVVLDLDGRRVTEADTRAFATARGGRPSSAGAGSHSPQVSLSMLVRRALERYLDDVAASQE